LYHAERLKRRAAHAARAHGRWVRVIWTRPMPVTATSLRESAMPLSKVPTAPSSA
jgi:hypothetical protein